MPQHAAACLSMPPHAAACLSMPPHASACRRMPQHAAACRRMPQHAAACLSMPPHASACRRMPRHASACHGMPPHAAACRRMPPHASACRRMPQHAAACRSMPRHSKFSLGTGGAWSRGERSANGHCLSAECGCNFPTGGGGSPAAIDVRAAALDAAFAAVGKCGFGLDCRWVCVCLLAWHLRIGCQAQPIRVPQGRVVSLKSAANVRPLLYITSPAMLFGQLDREKGHLGVTLVRVCYCFLFLVFGTLFVEQHLQTRGFPILGRTLAWIPQFGREGEVDGQQSGTPGSRIFVDNRKRGSLSGAPLRSHVALIISFACHRRC